MAIRKYGERLGMLADEQFQAALDRFNLGQFIQAEAIPFGSFGQNVFVTSTTGEYVLRGTPHIGWQFPTEQFYSRLLHERTQVPVAWPYLLDPAEDIFGWSYALMPRMSGLQLADPQVRSQLGAEERRGIARALGENLALMQELTWPFCGRYDASTDTVQPLEPLRELAWPFPVQTAVHARVHVAIEPGATVTYGELVIARILHYLTLSRTYDDHTTADDVAWTEQVLMQAKSALDVPFQPCFVMEDYKRDNLVVTRQNGTWRVSGLFDLMSGYFGDGETDLARTVGMYLHIDKDPPMAREFVQAYLSKRPPRPGFAERFQVYLLLDRAILWEYAHKTGQRWWDERWTFRDCASQCIDADVL